MKKEELKRVNIYIGNQAEKLTAIHTLSALTGLPVSESLVRSALRGDNITQYPYVAVDAQKTINAFSKPISSNVVGFCDIATLFPVKEVTVKLNDEYSAIVSPDGIKVGCQKFSIDTLKELYQAYEQVLNDDI